MITDYKHEDRLEKLRGKSYEESLKLIYEWIKKGTITFKMFRTYMETVAQRKEIDDNDEKISLDKPKGI